MENQVSEGRIILIDKPYTWTSFDVVKKIRYKLKLKKVGHAGTLDPLATGLLILCTDRMTKKINLIVDQEKEYTGTMVIGKTTPSVDLETNFDSEKDWSHISEEDCIALLANFTGEIEQVPPIYSAVKIDGKRAYEKARKGEKAEIKAKIVRIDIFELTRIDLPEIDFRIVCSKGTYIRSLVRDFGEKLGTGAYLKSLRRTRIGQFSIKDALKIEEVE